MNEENKPGIVQISGRNYKTVALRITEMRDEHPEWGVDVEIIENNDSLVLIKAYIRDDQNRIIGTGHAEEIRGATKINKTSALENCETSAIGRSLAACGYGGEEYASANETQDALVKQALSAEFERMKNHTQSMLSCSESIAAIKNGIAAGRDSDDYKVAAEAWFELDPIDKKALWRAPTKGGVFTTKEREEIRAIEFRVAYYGHENLLESTETNDDD